MLFLWTTSKILNIISLPAFTHLVFPYKMGVNHLGYEEGAMKLLAEEMCKKNVI